jgi:hypothetical protein
VKKNLDKIDQLSVGYEPLFSTTKSNSASLNTLSHQYQQNMGRIEAKISDIEAILATNDIWMLQRANLPPEK